MEADDVSREGSMKPPSWVREFINDRAAAAGNYVLPSVRQLAVPDESETALIPAGSCVLTWHRGSRYLLTASHVARLYTDCTYYLGTNTSWVALPGGFMTLADPALQEIYDFAFRQVSESEAALFDGCMFLTATQIAMRDQPVYEPPYRSKYLALGFPLNKFKLNRPLKVSTQKSVAYTGTIKPIEQHRSIGLDPTSHIVTDYNARAVAGPKGVQRSPKLVGLSGGGMFSPANRREGRRCGSATVGGTNNSPGARTEVAYRPSHRRGASCHR